MLGLGRSVSLTELLSLIVGWDLWVLGLPSCCVLGRGLSVAWAAQSSAHGVSGPWDGPWRRSPVFQPLL